MAVNKVVYGGNTLIDLTSDTATASDVAQGKTFHLADGTQATGTASGGGGSSSWTHIIHAEYTVSTTSTSRGSVATLSCGTDIWTSSKIVYVRIRDTAGARNGYFVGTDTFYVNARPANGSVATTGASELLCACTRREDSGSFATFCGSGSGAYGVFPYSMYSNGRIQISKRYNASNSLTIDGTYSVDVFTLDYPNGYDSPFVGSQQGGGND